MNSNDSNSLDLQKALVSRYVAGDLSRSERIEFETWLVASPELADEVELERKLRRGMLSAARRGWLERHEQPPASSRRWQIAAAASFLLAAVIGIVLLPRQDLPDAPVAERDLPRIAAVLSFDLAALRSISPEPDIALSRSQLPRQLVINPDVVTLTCEDGRVDLECPNGLAPSVPQYPAYELELLNRREATLVWRSTPQPADSKRLSFAIEHAHSLAPGDYDLVVRGMSNAHQEVVARFWLKVSADK
jgi:hypothetical protein